MTFRHLSIRFTWLGVIVLAAGWAFSPAWSQSADAPAAPSDAESQDGLTERQELVANQFKRFERTIRDLAEYMRRTDPARADLLIRAYGQSKKDQIALQMQTIIRLLEQEKLGDAKQRQEELVGQLRQLLQLLQSEDRMSEIEKEKRRLEDLLKDLKKITARQKDIRFQTERGQPAGKIAEGQQGVSDATDKLADKIDKQDVDRQKAGDQENADRESEQAEPGDKEHEDGEKKPEDGKQKPESEQGKPSENGAEQKPGEQSPSAPNENEKNESEQPKSPAQSQPAPPGQQQQQQQQQQGSPPPPGEQPPPTPGREEIEKARQQMKQAIERLKEEQHNKAAENQDQALQQLAEAKEKLEEILRQLREEERELVLEALEARFQKMLAMQMMVYTGTVSIGKVPEAQRTSRHSSKAIQLARDEEQIVLEAEKTLGLLKEEGSSVAFPEAVEQLKDDMLLVVSRLERMEMGEFTQGVEQDIINALEEIIEALQKAIEDSKKKQQQQSGQQNSQQQEQGLVDMLGELKMLRTLQVRINRMTKRYGDLIESSENVDPDVVNQLQELSRRQARLQKATHYLSMGKQR